MEFAQEHTPSAEAPEEFVFDRENESVSFDSPIRELKSAMLSLDWEITDSILLRFSEEIHGLQATLHRDEHSLRLLQILDAVGKYIRTKLARAHPLSIRTLHDSYDILEELVLKSGSLPPDYKTKQVTKALNAFHELKAVVNPDARVKKQQTPFRGKTAPKSASRAAPPHQADTKQETADDYGYSSLIRLFRSMIQEELKIFKKELLAELKAILPKGFDP